MTINWGEVVFSIHLNEKNLEMKLPPKITIADHFKDLEDKRVEESIPFWRL